MKILHTEASPGWGGQELRILREAEGMRARGHEVILVVQKGGGLVAPAREAGFLVYETPFAKKHGIGILFKLLYIIYKHRIQIINTHSSLDSWIAGVAGKVTRRKVIRTRHLSTPIREGWNSKLLYNWLPDSVVTTCEEAAEMIKRQANLPPERCRSIPTGVDPTMLTVDPDEVARFRESIGVEPHETLAGTLCVLRGWKGVSDLLGAAKILEDHPHLKWLIVGGGVSEDHLRKERKAFGLEKKVIFTGHLDVPYTALAAMDIFLLLSWANEGVSQASLQAAWLKKPLITTPIGGLGEVCLDGETGLQVPIKSPSEVAKAVERLLDQPQLRPQMGEEGHKRVKNNFTLRHTLDGMERIYQ